jgi:nucleoside-diphosphate-sugar epimerase
MNRPAGVLVTGANGFVGSALCDRLKAEGYNFRRAVRARAQIGNSVAVGNIGPDTQWEVALLGVDTVIHTAARAHIMKDEIDDPLAEYRKVNVEGTLNLARQAEQAGVKRFIFISSIKVNGENTLLGKPFAADDTLAPEDPYGVSKCEAEQGLQHFAQEMGMEVVIIRPPLVYGPGVEGNFASMMRLVRKGIPLPLGAIHNKRSLVALDNLVDLIITCIDHPAAANQVFLAGDGEDLSTTDLLRGTAKAMRKPALLVPVPARMLTFSATLLGKKAVAQRVLGSLQVDISKARNELEWEPPVSVEEGLRRCVQAEVKDIVSPNHLVFRSLDIVLSVCGLIVTSPILLLLMIVGLFDTGSPLFCQERVGKDRQPFFLVKFRTMKVDTVSVASHLASPAAITPLGHFLRRTKLDELPQLWNVLKGEMSLVGPRPCLFNQEELIDERGIRGVFQVRPGITGLAQVNDIDMSTPKLLAETDAEMIRGMSIPRFFSYILQTVVGKGAGDRIKK